MTPVASALSADPQVGWPWPLDLERYDRRAALTPVEQRALQALADSPRWWGDLDATRSPWVQAPLRRLIAPIHDAMAGISGERLFQSHATATLLRACQREQQAFWGWTAPVWCRVLGTSQAHYLYENRPFVHGEERHCLIAAAYLLRCFQDFRALGKLKRLCLATKIFGPEAVQAALHPIQELLARWGYVATNVTCNCNLVATICEALLLNQSPRLEDLTAERLDAFRRGASPGCRAYFLQFSKALAALGLIAEPLGIAPPRETSTLSAQNPDLLTRSPAPRPLAISSEWVNWVRRWEETSTLTRGARLSHRKELLKLGRWLADRYPAITSPAQWDRELGIAFVAAVNRLQAGDYIGEKAQKRVRPGQPLAPSTKESCLVAVRGFFRDCQEWGWIPVRFNPGRVFATPRSLQALLGPAPRTIAAETWARLVWAGLHFTVDDLDRKGASVYYPLEMLHALAAVWLFAGLRSDELTRLRVGCVRWPPSGGPGTDNGASGAKPTICSLDIPVHKTGSAFTKPVDALVGERINAREKLRPAQPRVADRKTGERVDLLFCYRARPVRREYLNETLIPLLCRKAGVAAKDGRGAITSHRARATIASQLFNCRDPMSLEELQVWLGHRALTTTQSYVALEPTRLTQAYEHAGYLARNQRAIEVLIDQDAIKSAAADSGAPWRYYDLGHGLCTYEFFEQCPHRFACPRCDFYQAKGSSRAQLLEAKTNLLRLLQEMPLAEEERAAIDGDLAALDRLVARLADQPTPSGQTPKELRGCVNQSA